MFHGPATFNIMVKGMVEVLIGWFDRWRHPNILVFIVVGYYRRTFLGSKKSLNQFWTKKVAMVSTTTVVVVTIIIISSNLGTRNRNFSPHNGKLAVLHEALIAKLMATSIHTNSRPHHLFIVVHVVLLVAFSGGNLPDIILAVVIVDAFHIHHQ